MGIQYTFNFSVDLHVSKIKSWGKICIIEQKIQHA